MSFSTDNNTTLTKVVLSCFGLLVGLWQFVVIGPREVCALPLDIAVGQSCSCFNFFLSFHKVTSR